MKRVKGYKLYFWILQWGMFHTYKPRVITKATFCFFRFWHHRCCIGSQNNLMVINPLTHSTWENQIRQLFKLSTAPDQERIKMGLYIIRAQKRENQNDYRITSSNGKPYFFLSRKYVYMYWKCSIFNPVQKGGWGGESNPCSICFPQVLYNSKGLELAEIFMIQPLQSNSGPWNVSQGQAGV